MADEILDTPEPPVRVNTDPTYHISIWDDPPSYVCLVCPARDMTLEGVTEHLLEVHALPAIPTPQMSDLLTLRIEALAQVAAQEPAADKDTEGSIV